MYSGLCDYCGINKGWAGNIEEISPPLLRSAVWLFSNMAERRDPQRNTSAESQRSYTLNTLNVCAGHRPKGLAVIQCHLLSFKTTSTCERFAISGMNPSSSPPQLPTLPSQLDGPQVRSDMQLFYLDLPLTAQLMEFHIFAWVDNNKLRSAF